MATDTYIKFDGIDGESTHQDHKGEIEVLSWNWGLSTSTDALGSGAGKTKATPRELRIVHQYDKASPVLGKNAASGKRLRSAVLTARKAGEGQKDFLKITMKEVFITSVSDSGDGTGTTEEIAMTYGAIDFSYRPQDSKGGLGSPVQFNWDIKTSKVS